jgi:hypothetical protein
MKYKAARINKESFEELKQYVSGFANPTHFFTMTEINKVGINPQSKYSTPIGVYAYPLTSSYYNKLINDSLPFAGEKPYINVFTLTQPVFNLSYYKEYDLEKDVEALSPDKSILQEAFSRARFSSPAGRFWNLTRLLANKDAKAWNTILRKLNYTNFYDPGEEIIHPSEPTQIVILDPRIISIVKTIYNPHAFIKEDEVGHVSPKDQALLTQRRSQEKSLKDKLRDCEDPRIIFNIAKQFVNNPEVIYNLAGNPNIDKNTSTFILENIDKYPNFGMDIVFYISDAHPDVLDKFIKEYKLPTPIKSYLSIQKWITDSQFNALINDPSRNDKEIIAETLLYKKLTEPKRTIFKEFLKKNPDIVNKIHAENEMSKASSLLQKINTFVKLTSKK